MYYCKYCGKPTENENAVCDECFAACLNNSTQPVPPTEDKPKEEKPAAVPAAGQVKEKPAANPFGVLYGFGMALTSTILSKVSIAFNAVSLILLWTICLLRERMFADFYDLRAFGYMLDRDKMLMIGIGSLALGLALSVMTTVFAAVSQRRYRQASKFGNVKPVATLVLGIEGLIYSILSLLIACGAGAFLVFWLF